MLNIPGLTQGCTQGCILKEECQELINQTTINYTNLHTGSLIVCLIIIAAHALYNIKEKDYGGLLFDAALTIFIIAAMINS